MATRKSIYGIHPAVYTTQTWIASLENETGRTLGAWLELVSRKGPKDEAGRRAWLEAEHGFATSSAWWIAERSFGRGMEDGDPDLYLLAAEAYVEAQYAGKRAALRPLYEALLRLGLSLGKDVQACPCKTMVPLYRSRVIAEIKPATLSRIDLGLALGKVKKTPKRLLGTGGLAKKERITHRFAIGRLDEIDGEVERWLKEAYDRDT